MSGFKKAYIDEPTPTILRPSVHKPGLAAVNHGNSAAINIVSPVVRCGITEKNDSIPISNMATLLSSHYRNHSRRFQIGIKNVLLLMDQ
jgi:hypothetical protein